MYGGGDINCTKQDSAAKCQELCQQTNNCKTFSYVEDTYDGSYGTDFRNTCCLKHADNIIPTDHKDILSGPKFCPGKWILQ